MSCYCYRKIGVKRCLVCPTTCTDPYLVVATGKNYNQSHFRLLLPIALPTFDRKGIAPILSNLGTGRPCESLLIENYLEFRRLGDLVAYSDA